MSLSYQDVMDLKRMLKSFRQSNNLDATTAGATTAGATTALNRCKGFPITAYAGIACVVGLATMWLIEQPIVKNCVSKQVSDSVAIATHISGAIAICSFVVH